MGNQEMPEMNDTSVETLLKMLIKYGIPFDLYNVVHRGLNERFSQFYNQDEKLRTLYSQWRALDSENQQRDNR